ncbi:hypothetical protein LJC53_06970, partial [Bacteroidales bacterium OttesenSCG-928-C03]|nr:hypothetical protein [Bacteroidales bacterium OttesenSCG-928-C03]
MPKLSNDPDNASASIARLLHLRKLIRLAKLVPETPGISLDRAFKEVPELKNELDNGTPLVKDTLRFALKLEGTIRNSGVHACGVIIGKNELSDSVP